MVRVSDHMACAEGLRESSLCSQAKIRVRGDILTVCSNLKRIATKVMVPKSSS